MKRIKWTKEKCQELALLYKTRNEFKKSSTRAYSAVIRNGWLEDVCSHMISPIKPTSYWSKERCAEEALKYKTKTEFEHNSQYAYSKSNKYKWLDEICSHMVHFGNIYNRLVYAYEFSDNFVYIGLTSNEKRRHTEHMTGERHNSSVYNHMMETNIKPIKKILSDGYIFSKDAQKLEKLMIEEYKNNGWSIINKAAGGSLGGNFLYWTKERCKEVALGCESRSEFGKKNRSAYDSSLKYNWLDEICEHMIQKRRPIDYWTKEKCTEEALKYTKKIDFYNFSSAAYQKSHEMKWLNEICQHMIQKYQPIDYWTKEKCQEEALKFNSRNEFKLQSAGAYNSSKRNNWLNEICQHMIPKNKPNNYWTMELCQEKALLYKTKKDFRNNDGGSYNAAYTNGWLNEICLHMIYIKKPTKYWNKERCSEESLKFNEKNQFRKKSQYAYSISRKNGWLDEICLHMK